MPAMPAVANIQTIGVKIDDGEYTPATPGVNRSTWSITLDMAPGPHTLKARADYGAGEQTWSIGNVLVNATSNAQATSNATSSENQNLGDPSSASINPARSSNWFH